MERSTFRRRLFALFVWVLMCSAALADAQPAPAAGVKALQLFSAAPAAFIENTGQIADPSIRYAFYGSGANIFHTTQGPVFQVFQQNRNDQMTERAPFTVRCHPTVQGQARPICYTFSATFPGARCVQPVGDGPDPVRVNYYIGDAPGKWRTNVAAYGSVIYPGLWDGIDLHTYGRRSCLKYEFRVAPGADWRSIVVRYAGIAGLYIDARGTLHIDTPLGEVVDDAPYAYQDINGHRQLVACRYRLIDETSYGFVVTEAFEEAYELVIDPQLEWGTYMGGNMMDFGNGIATDAAGNVFVTGYSASTNFPTQNGFDSTNGGGYRGDVIIAKISPDCRLLWSSFLGGTQNDIGHSVAVDADGNAYVTGTTESSDFPVCGPIQGSYGGGLWGDMFVAKVTADGQLAWSQFLGGPGSDSGLDITVDRKGDLLITGSTDSISFPTPNWNATHHGKEDILVIKMAASGELLWGNLLGGTGDDHAWSIAANADGSAVIAGYTSSTDFPTLGYTTPHKGQDDVVVAKLDASGKWLWARLHGGSVREIANSVALDRGGNAYITGWTTSPDFPTPGGFDTTYSGGDAFVMRVDPAGVLLWATYLGGSNDDYGEAVAVDRQGNAIVHTQTSSSGLPTPGGFTTQRPGGAFDLYFARMTPAGTITWGTYLGGSDWDYGGCIALDPYDNIVVASTTRSRNFPTPGGFDTSYNGSFTGSGLDVFDIHVAKIDMGVAHYVDDDAPSDPAPGDPAVSDPAENGSKAHPFDSIQEAIDACPDGQIVVVRPGVYRGQGNRDIDFHGKAVTLISETGPDDCIIDCGGEAEPHRAFNIHSSEGAGCVVQGFTILCGKATSGGAIYIHASSPTIVGNVIAAGAAVDGGAICGEESAAAIVRNHIIGNDAVRGGGLLFRGFAQPIVSDNVILGNSADESGGGIFCESSCTVAGNVIGQNTAGIDGGGISCLGDGCGVVVSHSVLYGNQAVQGGGLAANGAALSITSSTVSGNRSDLGGAIRLSSGASASVANCILWGNQAAVGPEIALSSASLACRYSDVAGGESAVFAEGASSLTWQDGNANTDPLFADPAAADFHLRSMRGRWRPSLDQGNGEWITDDTHSPCIDAGDPAFDYAEEPHPNGSRINIGAYGGTPEASMSARFLNVTSQAVFGIPIMGDKPGTTNYTAMCDDQQIVNLSAPATTTIGGSEYSFVRWTVDGTDQPDWQTSLDVLMDADHTVTAVYFKHCTLSVRSSPVAGVNISGDKPGKTNYTTVFDRQQTVNLTAQEGIIVGGKTFLFVRWLRDDISQPLRETSLQITMVTDHTAEAVYNLLGDVNADCKINVLDLILVRNRLGQSTATGDNWKADLDQDGRITVLDLILLRNRLGTGCP